MDGYVAISQAEKSDNFTFAFNMSHWIINTDFLKMHTEKHLKKEAGNKTRVQFNPLLSRPKLLFVNRTLS